MQSPDDTGNLETILFLLGLAVTFGLEAVKAETIARRSMFWGLTLLSLLAALGWTEIRPLCPPLSNAVMSVSSNPVAWFVVGMFFLAVIAFHRPNSTTVVRRSALPATTPQVDEQAKRNKERVFVDVTPDYLLKIKRQKNLTAIQSDRVLEPYMGKWIKVTGKIVQMFERMTFLRLGVDEDRQPIDVTLMVADEWKSQFHVLPLGHEVTAIGWIDEIRWSEIQLRECEIVIAAPISHQAATLLIPEPPDKPKGT
jgi:hypothetical protein